LFFFSFSFPCCSEQKNDLFCFALFNDDDFGILFFKQMRNGEMILGNCLIRNEEMILENCQMRNGEMILENCQMSNRKWGYKFMIFFFGYV
jgi:hypothetical protein